MKKSKNILIIVFCLLFAPAQLLLAQNNLDSMEFVSIGDYQPTVMDAVKISANPSIADSTRKLPVSSYNIDSRQIATHFTVEPIKPAKMLGEPLTKLYNSYVKVGMGNYITPYAELWVNNLRSKNISAGARVKHLSSTFTDKDYGFAGFSDNEISLYGKRFLKKHSLIGNVDYTRNVYHLYGYDTELYSLDKDSTQQVYNFISGDVEIKSHYSNKKKVNHNVKLKYYNFSGPLNSVENNISLSGGIKTAVGDEFLDISAKVDYYNYQMQTDTLDNTIVTINPTYVANGERYALSLGLIAAADVTDETDLYIYPNVDFSYNVFENIIVPYAGVTGNIVKNSYKLLSDNNPFVRSDLAMMNTKNPSSLFKTLWFGGIRGTLSATTSFNAQVSHENVENMALYVNDTSEFGNKFNVLYDDVEVLKINGEMAYQLREKLRINIAGEYNNYTMKNEVKAWYKPQVKLSLSGNYNLKDKFVVRLDLFYIDKQFAKTYVTDTSATVTTTVMQAKELKGVFDANLGVEYRFNKKLGFYLNLNNIGNMRYYRWSNYPTQQFSFMGGLSFSF